MSEVEQKNCCPVVISKDQIIPGTEFYDMWNVGSAPDYKAQVPIFSVYNMHGLNAIIGYVMLINSNAGKVLYRGQTRLYCGENGRYNDLLPSFCHLHPVKGEELKAAKRRWNSEAKANVKSLDKHIEAIINDPDLLKQIILVAVCCRHTYGTRNNATFWHIFKFQNDRCRFTTCIAFCFSTPWCATWLDC